jgi:hypothetical protein
MYFTQRLDGSRKSIDLSSAAYRSRILSSASSHQLRRDSHIIRRRADNHRFAQNPAHTRSEIGNSSTATLVNETRASPASDALRRARSIECASTPCRRSANWETPPQRRSCIDQHRIQSPPLLRPAPIDAGIQAGLLAEGVGFEPTSDVSRCRFSRPVPSTARPPLLLAVL